MRPTLFLLCGLPGTGKTTWARSLESEGVSRFSLDETTLRRLASERDPLDDMRVTGSRLYSTQAEIEREHIETIRRLLADGVSVIADDGFWAKTKRDRYKAVAEEVGAHWRLLLFEVPEDEQWRRLNRRNKGDLSTVHFISRDEMHLFAGKFERPDGEGEELAGLLPPVRSALGL